MALKIDDVCSRCGKSSKDFPGKVWSFRMGPPVICYVCEPLPLEGDCPTCGGHGTVYLFEAWVALNQVSNFDYLTGVPVREFFLKCRTRAQARSVLENLRLLDRYPLLPDWLPEA